MLPHLFYLFVIYIQRVLDLQTFESKLLEGTNIVVMLDWCYLWSHSYWGGHCPPPPCLPPLFQLFLHWLPLWWPSISAPRVLNTRSACPSKTEVSWGSVTLCKSDIFAQSIAVVMLKLILSLVINCKQLNIYFEVTAQEVILFQNNWVRDVTWMLLEPALCFVLLVKNA